MTARTTLQSHRPITQSITSNPKYYFNPYHKVLNKNQTFMNNFSTIIYSPMTIAPIKNHNNKQY